jgi:hypothetical protein
LRSIFQPITTRFPEEPFFKRLLAYHETGQQGLHTRQYNIKNFHVLTVTSSPERVEHLIEANKKIGGGRGSKLCLFTHEKAVETCNDLLTLEWRNGLGETSIRLAPR